MNDTGTDQGTAQRAGVTLAWRDHGGDRPPVLLLHGLAGYGGEWDETASWLTAHARVIAPDARGHGASERFPDDVSPAATAEDAAYLIDRLGLGPVTVVGQSLGGLTAIQLAAGHPDRIRGVVLIEASPSTGDPAAAARAGAAIAAGLRSWPVPFPSRAAAAAFLADRFGSAPAAAVWAAGLEPRPDGLWPRWDPAVMGRMLQAAVAEPSWPAWESIRVPALVVRATGGDLDAATAAEMARRRPGCTVVEITSASHDVHLDQPRDWQRALTAFLDRLPSAGAGT